MSKIPRTKKHIMDLPYDIRFLIYSHLLPLELHIYIQAYKSAPVLQAILPNSGLSTSVMRTCKQLNDEYGGYLYNKYIFSIVGTKRDCLSAYKGYLKTLEKYAREEVEVHAFTNGDHSNTMCISMHAGEAKRDVLRSRRKGQAVEIEALREEVRMKESNNWIAVQWVLASIICGLAAILGWMWSHNGQRVAVVNAG